MRKSVLLCGILLLLSVAAAARDNLSELAAAPLETAPLPASPQVLGSAGLTDWQISIGYQFTRLNMPAVKGLSAFTVNDHGLNISFTRFLNSWAGLEGEVGDGFGSASVAVIPSARSLFVGGGPRLAYRGHRRYEPWVHGVVGMEHFRFTQTATAYGSNTALGYLVGGGMDYHLNQRVAIRIQGDYLGTRLFSANQGHWQVVAALVFNF
jgi:opacity protein-like surface antigen